VIGALVSATVVLAVALFGLAGWHVFDRRKPHRRLAPAGAHRILFPIVANALTRRALDASLRLARVEEATLVPVFLARVALQSPLDSPLPLQSSVAIPLLEAIERRAARFAVPVDARIERGRSYRHALRQMMDHEQFDRIVIAAGTESSPGFVPEDIAWLLRTAPGELIVVRPARDDTVIALPASTPEYAEFAVQGPSG
jgi:nucleotide-binding universal stress UspA family protein